MKLKCNNCSRTQNRVLCPDCGSIMEMEKEPIEDKRYDAIIDILSDTLDKIKSLSIHGRKDAERQNIHHIEDLNAWWQNEALKYIRENALRPISIRELIINTGLKTTLSGDVYARMKKFFEKIDFPPDIKFVTQKYKKDVIYNFICIIGISNEKEIASSVTATNKSISKTDISTSSGWKSYEDWWLNNAIPYIRNHKNKIFTVSKLLKQTVGEITIPTRKKYAKIIRAIENTGIPEDIGIMKDYRNGKTKTPTCKFHAIHSKKRKSKQTIQKSTKSRYKHDSKLYNKWWKEHGISYIKSHPNEKISLTKIWQDTTTNINIMNIPRYDTLKKVINGHRIKGLHTHFHNEKRKRNYIIYKVKDIKNDGAMIRQHAYIPRSFDERRINLAQNASNKEYKPTFPNFSTLTEYMNSILPELIKTKIIKKGGFIDFTYMNYLGIEDEAQYLSFLDEFIMESNKICKYFNISNKFSIEGDSNEKRLVYKGDIKNERK